MSRQAAPLVVTDTPERVSGVPTLGLEEFPRPPGGGRSRRRGPDRRGCRRGAAHDERYDRRAEERRAAASQSGRLRLRLGRVRLGAGDRRDPGQRPAVPHRRGRQRAVQPLRRPAGRLPGPVHPGRLARHRRASSRSPTRWWSRPCWPGSSTDCATRGERRARAACGRISYGGAKIAAEVIEAALRAVPRHRLRQRVRPDRDRVVDRGARAGRPPRGARRATTRGARPARLGRSAAAGGGDRGPRRGRRGAARRASPARSWVRGAQVAGEYLEAGRQSVGRLVPHPRPWLRRRGRLPVRPRPGRRHDHPRRREHRPRRDRGRARPAPRGRRRVVAGVPTRSGASASRPSSSPAPGGRPTRRSAGAGSASGCAAPRRPTASSSSRSFPTTPTGKVSGATWSRCSGGQRPSRREEVDRSRRTSASGCGAPDRARHEQGGTAWISRCLGARHRRSRRVRSSDGASVGRRRRQGRHRRPRR